MGCNRGAFYYQIFQIKTPAGELQMDLVGYSAVEEVRLKISCLFFDRRQIERGVGLCSTSASLDTVSR